MNIATLAAAYQSGELTPTAIINSLCDRADALTGQPVWIHRIPRAELLARTAELEALPPAARPALYGIPFAIKDNIDVAGLPTTAGCPAYSYTPETTAPAVARLLDAGAILIGKTNMDQFATGLVGVRSPYGACSSVFSPDHISGGSSSGSAVAVAANLVAFSLGTDTAGSGRIPAAFNNLIGLKPTRGRIPTVGVVPACQSLDCISVFANTPADAAAALHIAQDASSNTPAPWLAPAALRLGVPRHPEFFGDEHSRTLFTQAIQRCQSLGMTIVEINYEPFRQTANLLYSGPWVAERLAAVESFVTDHSAEMDPTVRAIIQGGARYSAVDTFRAQYTLEELRAATNQQWQLMDVLLLPTAATIYRKDEVLADPIKLNTNLGYYTNFVNLLDLAAVAAPAGFRPDGLPFGIQFIGPAHSDLALLELAARFSGHPYSAPTGCIELAVVGAHLTGQPLNHQLTSRNARLLRTCRTAPDYRLYALPNTTPPKPGLVRDPAYQGPGIEVETWLIPEAAFGSFVAQVPAPLGIGTITLDDRSTVKGFICEPSALTGATEITSHGGWRNYLKAERT